MKKSRGKTMKRRWWMASSLLIGYVAMSNACGPFFSEAVFVRGTGPDGNYAEYVKGRIGIPQPGYRMRYLVVAYDWLNGRGLSPMEQQEAIAVEQELHSPPQTDPGPQNTRPAAVQWAQARAALNVTQADAAPTREQSKPPTAQEQQADASVRDAMVAFSAERPAPGEDYTFFTNCLTDAYTTAVASMAARKSAHGNDAASFADWVRGQDAVFQNCDGKADAMPAAVTASAPQWLRQDRAYQRAAATFYQMDYDAAILQLRAVAADSSSPWNKTARMVIARALIRRGTVGQITDLPSAMRAPQSPGAPFDARRQALLQQYENTVRERQTARLKQAATALEAIVADPSLQPFQHSAAGLLDMVRFKVDPAAQALVLEQRLTGMHREQAPGVFRQALIDLSYYPDGDLPGRPGGGSEPRPIQPAQADVLGFIRTMHGEVRPRSELGSVNYQELAPEASVLAAAKKNALNIWLSTHEAVWLLAALTSSDRGDAEVSQLLAAAKALPADSPGAVAAKYYQLRLGEPAESTRGELDGMLPTVIRRESRSTVNLFRILQQRNSASLADFLDRAGLLPAAETDEDDPEVATSTASQDGLCHVHSSDAATLLFDHDAATVLNTRMPLQMLAEAAAHPGLAPNLRFQIAQSTWARAMLLGRPSLARQMDGILSDCYPAWKPVLAKYDAATNPTDREAERLLALMRFASTEPIVREGSQRPEGFATYSSYRDNWWPESRGSTTDPSSAGLPATFFGSMPATVKELPDPQWLTMADRAAAATEIAALRRVPCASDYFASEALQWQKQHAEDARTPEILGSAERVVRSGCRTDATKELNHRLFLIVQTKYPKSKWAALYSTWE